jgi:ABC-type lipoprotein export system ATPase subunit
VYAGLRDIALEAQEEAANQAPPPPPPGYPVGPLPIERKASTRLKNLGQLAQEFEQLLATIRRNGDFELLGLALRPVLREPSFLDLEEKSLQALVGDHPAQAFLRWSTGHKIVMHVVASLLANAKHRSLVLFDEPETHLHPPLVAALMHAVRVVLEQKNAFAIVATHSPVVLQETLAKHVRIVERIESDFNVTQPSLETFGENVGILTYDTFRLTGESTDFHNSLDELIKAYSSVEEINTFFTPALSGQALGYVMAGLAKKGRAQ